MKASVENQSENWGFLKILITTVTGPGRDKNHFVTRYPFAVVSWRCGDRCSVLGAAATKYRDVYDGSSS